jgi:hypothetical protein
MASRCFGVMPPKAMFGRSWCYIHIQWMTLYSVGARAYSGTADGPIKALMADQITIGGNLSKAYHDEVRHYTAAKYQSQGSWVAVTQQGATYDLSVSANTSMLIDDGLLLNHALGAGKDTVLAKDLVFRHIDGGLGWDTFVLHRDFSGGVFTLSDCVSNARGVSGDAMADARVNAHGYHRLMGFEKLDFSQSTAKQSITIHAMDVDQLAEKNLVGDPNRAANTSNLYALLGANDHMVANGFANFTRGYWQDVDGLVYDRRYTQVGGSVGAGDTANLFVRGGDDAPEFGNTSTAATYTLAGASTTLNFAFNETMEVRALTANQFTVNGVEATGPP